jgi:hypothetical protein
MKRKSTRLFVNSIAFRHRSGKLSGDIEKIGFSLKKQPLRKLIAVFVISSGFCNYIVEFAAVIFLSRSHRKSFQSGYTAVIIIQCSLCTIKIAGAD